MCSCLLFCKFCSFFRLGGCHLLLIIFDIQNEPGHEKMCLMSSANNKGADQPAHPRSLISAFIVRCLDNIISLDSITEISRLYLASVAAQASLCLVWSETPEDTFCRVVAQIYYTNEEGQDNCKNHGNYKKKNNVVFCTQTMLTEWQTEYNLIGLLLKSCLISGCT